MDQTEIRRPGGITLIMVLAIISAIMSIFAGIFILLDHDDRQLIRHSGLTENHLTGTGIAIIVLGVIGLVIALALGRGSRLARLLFGIWAVLEFAGGVYGAITLYGEQRRVERVLRRHRPDRAVPAVRQREGPRVLPARVALRPRPAGRALLGEGARPSPCVVARQHARAEPCLDAQCLFHRADGKAPERALLGRRDREGCVLGDASRPLLCARGSRCRGTISLSRPISSARVADTGSAVSRNSIAAGHGIWRGSARSSRRWRRSRAAARARRTPPRAREADVGAVEHLHPARDARPVHRGDDRLVDVEIAQHGLGAGSGTVSRVVGPRRREQRDVVAEVTTGAEASSTPVRIATQASGSSRNRFQASASASKCSRSSALRRAGRSMEIVTTWSSRS